jgi:hypothetical protein
VPAISAGGYAPKSGRGSDERLINRRIRDHNGDVLSDDDLAAEWRAREGDEVDDETDDGNADDADAAARPSDEWADADGDGDDEATESDMDDDDDDVVASPERSDEAAPTEPELDPDAPEPGGDDDDLGEGGRDR